MSEEETRFIELIDAYIDPSEFKSGKPDFEITRKQYDKMISDNPPLSDTKS